MNLEDLQAWFGRAISRPLPGEYRGNPLAASAPDLEAEAAARVQGRGGLAGFERMGIYNQQYWFRLITLMQEGYACAVHLLGLRAYNDWAVRFLTAHPPASPYLSQLDAAWPAFMEREYRGKDREAVLEALAYDRAFTRAVDAPDGKPLVAAGGASPESGPAGGSAGVAPETPLGLAPHASVVRLSFDFPAFRPLCLADESLEKDIPLAPGGSPMVIWRGRDLALWQRAISPAACMVLEALREPTTVAEAFAGLAGALTSAEEEELAANLAQWFEEWTREGIVCRP